MPSNGEFERGQQGQSLFADGGDRATNATVNCIFSVYHYTHALPSSTDRDISTPSPHQKACAEETSRSFTCFGGGGCAQAIYCTILIAGRYLRVPEISRPYTSWASKSV